MLQCAWSRYIVSVRSDAARPTKASCFCTRRLLESEAVLQGFVSESDTKKADVVAEARGGAGGTRR
jgi:hypothetical protein